MGLEYSKTRAVISYQWNHWSLTLKPILSRSGPPPRSITNPDNNNAMIIDTVCSANEFHASIAGPKLLRLIIAKQNSAEKFN